MATLGASLKPPNFSRATATQLLATQAFLGGFTLSMLFAVANTLFLKDYGVDWFPAMYIASAIAIPAATLVYKRASDLVKTQTLFIGTNLMLFLAYLAVWLTTVIFAQQWMSFAMMVFFGVAFIYQLITIPVQSSYLFDLQAIKTQTPIILASQTGALIVSGLLVGVLTAILDGVSNLLLICMLMAGLQAAVTWHTVRKFSASFEKSSSLVAARQEASWGEALQNQFGRTIGIYRFFSFLGSEMVVLLLALFAARIFTTEQGLATFFGNVMAIGTLLTLLFLVLIAGRLLKRYGLGFGLVSNPVFVAAPIVLVAVMSLFGQVSEIVVLGVVTTARVIDFILSVGASEPSGQTMYQALPERVRPSIVNMSESLILPMVYGTVGVGLYALRWLELYTVPVLILITLIVCALWTAFSYRTRGLYAKALLSKLQQRGISDADFTFDDPQSQAVIMQLTQSDNLHTAQMALGLLEKAAHADYSQQVLARLDLPDPEAQIDALARLERLSAYADHTKVLALTTDATLPAVRAAAITTLASSQSAAGMATLKAALHHTNRTVRGGALVGVLKHGRAATQLSGAFELLDLSKSDLQADKLLLAQTLAKIGPHEFDHLVASLLLDESEAVRRAALLAVPNAPHEALIPLVIQQLANTNTRSAAADALAVYGNRLRPVILQALTNPTQANARFVQLTGAFDNGTGIGIASDLLLRHLQHPSLRMRDAVRNALYRADYLPQTDAERTYVSEAVDTDCAQICALLGLHTALTELNEVFAQLQSALAAELRQSIASLLRLVSLETGGKQLRRLSRLLSMQDAEITAQALEGIFLSLPQARKATLQVLLDRELTLEKKAVALRKQGLVPTYTLTDALQLIIKNETGQLSDVVQAIAVYELAQQETIKQEQLVATVVAADQSLTMETLHWATHPTGDHPMLTIEKIAILKETELFSSVPNGPLAAVAQIVDVLELPANQTLIHDGDAAQEMFIISSGKVQVRKHGKPILELGEGDTVGEFAVFDAKPRSADVITLEPTTLLVIAQDTLHDVMLDRPEVNSGIIRTLVGRLRAQTVLTAQEGEVEA